MQRETTREELSLELNLITGQIHLESLDIHGSCQRLKSMYEERTREREKKNTNTQRYERTRKVERN